MTAVDAHPPAGLVDAQRLAVDAAEHAVTIAEAGITEIELAAEAERYAREHGAAGFWSITNVGFGAGSMRCFPTEHPTARQLWDPDVGHVDIHPITDDGWRGDCTRTVLTGEMPEHEAMLRCVTEIHDGLLTRLRPAMPVRELYEWFEAQYRARGLVALDRLHNVGHSLAREGAYEDGYIDRHNTRAMTGAWAIEPFVGNHLYGVKLEDVVWCGAEGSAVLGRREHEFGSSTRHDRSEL